MVSPENHSPMAKKPKPLSSSSSSSQRYSDGFLFLVGSLFAVILVWSLWSISAPKSRPIIDLREETPVTDDSAEKRSLEDPPAGRSFYVGAPVKGWDEKRREWLKRNPNFAGNKKERILMVTGSQPQACKNPIGDHLLLRFFKNKVDYCRIHGHEIFYNDALLNPLMGSYWAKLPVVRAAMLAHPEADWIWWVDSDAAFTDMAFSLPLDRYSGHHLVVHGWAHLVHKKRSWTGLNAGVFLIRNSQWAMDFIEDWAQMGPQTPNYEKWGGRLKQAFPDKSYPESDDQTGLAYLIVDPKRKWTDGIYLESEYYFEGYWDEIVNEKRLLVENATSARPFVTHFTGCQPCSGAHNEMYEGESCWDGMRKALNYADNQVLRAYGFVHPSLLDSSVQKIRYDTN